ncbi:membrane protein FAM174A [Hyperolius riggenbachi]|uniref:membrane protein FAM174A n=1 Tax=Hyperolius riggenbachi TaxID=752182 RepID=UPI0035A30029
MSAGGRKLWPVSWLSGALFLGLCCMHSSPEPSPAIPASPTGGPKPPIPAPGNSSDSGGPAATIPPPDIPRPQTQRALAVLVLVSAAVIVVFVIRTIRTRRTNKKTRKYGVLDTNIGNMELTPLEQEDEDDDTLFDANNPRR